MSLKQAAEELLKIADQIEKDAAEVTEFVCDKCKHTASLASINQKRLEASKEAGDNVAVAEVTVDDKLHCPACEGIMSYNATEASEPYYAAEKKDDEEEKACQASIDYDTLERYSSK